MSDKPTITPAPWELCILNLPLVEVPEYTRQCITASEGIDFYIVRAKNSNGDWVDVCHLGNGPTSSVNGHYIQQLPALLEELDSLREALARCDKNRSAWRLLSVSRGQKIDELNAAVRDAALRLDQAGIAEMHGELKHFRAQRAALENALYRISLASQNSMSSKEECGRIARGAIATIIDAPVKITPVEPGPADIEQLRHFATDIIEAACAVGMDGEPLGPLGADEVMGMAEHRGLMRAPGWPTRVLTGKEEGDGSLRG